MSMIFEIGKEGREDSKGARDGENLVGSMIWRYW